MKFLILADQFSGLTPWLLYSKKPVGMPAVYNLFQHLGESEKHNFQAYIITRAESRKITFPNGSVLNLKKLSIKNHIFFRLASYFLMIRLAIFELNREKFDVVYGMANYSLCGSLVGWLYGVPVVNRVFGTLATAHMKSGRYFLVYTRHILEYITARFSKGILISTNDGTQYDEFVRLVKRKNPFYHLYNGIDSNLSSALLGMDNAATYFPKSAIRIYSIGRLTAWKRHDQAIEILRKLRIDSRIDYRLTILGSGPESIKLQKKIDDLNLSDFAEIVEPVPKEQYISLLKLADICLFCYDHSNLGNALWESALSGRLIAAKNSGDTGNILKDNENSITVTDDEWFVDNMASRILLSTSLENQIAVSMIERARNDVRQLIPSWEIRIGRELSIIEESIRV